MNTKFCYKPLVLALLLYSFSCVDKGELNFRNSLKVREKMTTKEVQKIMGKPDMVYNDTTLLDEIRKDLEQDFDSFYFYTPPFEASDGIYFYFKNDSVAEIGRE